MTQLDIVSIAEIAMSNYQYSSKLTYNKENNEFISIGGGSGVVISADGLILTNHHVIDEAEAVKVFFEDGRMYEAEIIGSDHAY